MLNGRTVLPSLIYFLFVFALYRVSFWLPSIIKAAGVTSGLSDSRRRHASRLTAPVFLSCQSSAGLHTVN